MKSKLFFSTILAIIFSLASANAFAMGSGYGFTVSPALMYFERTIDLGTPPTTDTSRTLMDLRVGYTMSNGLYLGGIYGQDTDAVGSSDDKITNMGASVGYIRNNFNVVFSYFIDSKAEVGSSTNKGTGMQVDLGYAINLGGWALGPQISYSQLTYTEVESAGVTSNLANDLKVSTLIPKLAFWFMF